jgi:hypothetical protein
LQTLMIYKWVNSIITLNSQVAKNGCHRRYRGSTYPGVV